MGPSAPLAIDANFLEPRQRYLLNRCHGPARVRNDDKHDTLPPVARYLKDVVGRTAQLESLSQAENLCLLEIRARSCCLMSQIGGERRRVPLPEWSLRRSRGSFDRRTSRRAFAVGGLVLSGFDDLLLVTLDGWGDGFFSKAFVRNGTSLRQISASPAIRSAKSHPCRTTERALERARGQVVVRGSGPSGSALSFVSFSPER